MRPPSLNELTLNIFNIELTFLGLKQYKTWAINKINFDKSDKLIAYQPLNKIGYFVFFKITNLRLSINKLLDKKYFYRVSGKKFGNFFWNYNPLNILNKLNKISQYLEACKPRWVNSNYIQYWVKSLRLGGLQIFSLFR